VLRQTTGSALEVLNKPRDELKLPLTLWAPELVLVVYGRVQVSRERVESSEGPVAYVALISSTVERRRQSENNGSSYDCIGRRRRSFDAEWFGRNVGGNLHGVDGCRYFVAGNSMTARFEVEGDAGWALEHCMTEGTLEVASTMSEGILMLRDSCKPRID